MPKIVYKIIIALLALYVVFPEPTDAIPFLGWLDEGVAISLIIYIYKNKLKSDTLNKNQELKKN